MRSIVPLAIAVALLAIFQTPARTQVRETTHGLFPPNELVVGTGPKVPWLPKTSGIAPRRTMAVTPWTPIKVNQHADVEPQNEPYVAVNPLDKNNIVCAYRDFRYGGGENGSLPIRSVGISATTDAGVTWHETLAVYNDHNRFSDPGVVANSFGTFYIITLDCITSGAFDFSTALYTVRASSDGGLTWAQAYPTDLPPGFHDKELMAVDNSPESPHYNELYVSGNGPSGHYVVHSPDGYSWSPMTMVGGYYISPAVGPHGEVYVARYTGGSVNIMHSLDGGASFTDVPVSGAYTPGASFSNLWNQVNCIPALAVDNSQSSHRGTVYAMWCTMVNGDEDLYLASSSDSGVTWTDPVRVNNDSLANGRDQFHYWVTVDDSGFVDAVFEDRRDDPANIFANTYFAQSRDGGKTFKNFRITPESFDPRLSPGQDARYGDYIGISAAKDRVVPVWNDTRSGNQDIYIALIDLNQVGSIRGVVFNDCNHNGVQDAGERVWPNVLVYLRHDNGVDTIRTDAEGSYHFDGLFAGSYTVVINDTTSATSIERSVELAAQQNATGTDFLVDWNSGGTVQGWNMVSIPKRDSPQLSTQVFPEGLLVGPYSFSHGYILNDTVRHGKGYWIKTGCLFREDLGGTPLLADTIQLHKGWNMVGTLGVNLSSASAVTDPAGISNMVFYGYSGEGYATASTLVSGKAYWLRAEADGSLILNSGAAAHALARTVTERITGSKIIITDQRGHRATLYVSDHGQTAFTEFTLPPKPPAGGFDVRFASQRSLDVIYSGDRERHGIQIQGAEGAVTLHWQIAPGVSYSLFTGTGTVRISGEGSNVIQVTEPLSLASSAAEGTGLPSGFVLYQNFPDPFNPATTIRYEIPEDAEVRLVVTDLLGREMQTLVNEHQPAGTYSVPFDASALSSGIYFYRIDAGRYHQTKKMAVLR